MVGFPEMNRIRKQQKEEEKAVRKAEKNIPKIEKTEKTEKTEFTVEGTLTEVEPKTERPALQAKKTVKRRTKKTDDETDTDND